MLSIRLSRVGKKKRPTYRIIVTEKSRDPWGKFLEILGSYNPHAKKATVKAERINHWLSLGAQLTPTVNNLLVNQKIIDRPKVRASKSRPGKKKRAALESAAKSEKDASAAPAKENTETKGTEKEIKENTSSVSEK